MSKRGGAEAPSAAAAAGAFDLAALERATFGDRALAREVLLLFDHQAERLLASIAAAPDERTRRTAAHTLKGAARGIGAAAVADTAEEVERAGCDPIDVLGALARLSARVAEARLALGSLIAQD